MAHRVVRLGSWRALKQPPQAHAVTAEGSARAVGSICSRDHRRLHANLLVRQFQQAKLPGQRRGALVDAPLELDFILPRRVCEGRGHSQVEKLGFRYSDSLPDLYRNCGLKVPPGKMVAIMRPSGPGKSTLTKLLQGFYQPADGQIKLDGYDIRHLSASELRHYFGALWLSEEKVNSNE